MLKAILIVQVTVSVLLILVILLQQRGGGLSSIFGGSSTIYRTKRGLEKGLFILTIILVTLFIAIGVINLTIQS